MTCREMDVVIASHAVDLALPRKAAEHVVDCEGCRLLVKAFDRVIPAWALPKAG
jgi:hypothetical protein